MSRLLPLLFLILLISSCKGRNTSDSNEPDIEDIYFDYKVFGSEDDEDLTVLIQFRLEDADGPTILLKDPARVELDGEIINADSSRYTGAFYEIQKPVSGFEGRHIIRFIDGNGKEYKEEFYFKPMGLVSNLPATITRGDLGIELKGVEQEDHITILLTDTSIFSEGINRVDTVQNSHILISKNDLGAVVNGPVHLELIRESEKPVRGKTGKGGMISISFGLSREFSLQD